MVIVSEGSVHHNRDSIVKQHMSHYGIDDGWHIERNVRHILAFSPLYYIIASNPWDGATHIQNLSCSFIWFFLATLLQICPEVWLINLLGASKSFQVNKEHQPLHLPTKQAVPINQPISSNCASLQSKNSIIHFL